MSMCLFISYGSSLLLTYSRLWCSTVHFTWPHYLVVWANPSAVYAVSYLGDESILQMVLFCILGRRACLGESLAKMEFFMFFVTFLQRYNVRFPEGYTASAEPKQNPLVRQPQNYQIVFEPRWALDRFKKTSDSLAFQAMQIRWWSLWKSIAELFVLNFYAVLCFKRTAELMRLNLIW